MSHGILGVVDEVEIVSLSGVIAPGPVTAATLAAGTRSRHAGGLITLGHILVEFPLMLLIMAGMSRLFESDGVRTGIAVVGGLCLVLMGVRMLQNLGRGGDTAATVAGRGPVWTGVILTGGNPYFLFWWVTVGLTLTSRAVELGVLGFAVFAVIHWLCDLVWLEALSWASFKGTRLLGGRSQKVVLGICSLALVFVGAMFLYDAGRRIAG